MCRNSRIRRDQNFSCWRDREKLKNTQWSEFRMLKGRGETQEVSAAELAWRTSRRYREQNLGCWTDAENLKKTQRAEFGLLNRCWEPQEDKESRIWDAEQMQRTSRRRRELNLGCWTDEENLKNAQRTKCGLLKGRGEPEEYTGSRISATEGMRRTSRMRRNQNFGWWRDAENLKNAQKSEFRNGMIHIEPT